MASPRFHQLTFYDYLRVLVQRFWYWAIPLAVSLIVASVYASMKEQVYISTTSCTVISWKEDQYIKDIGSPELLSKRLAEIVDSFQNRHMFYEAVLRLSTPLESNRRLRPLESMDDQYVLWEVPVEIKDPEIINIRKLEDKILGVTSKSSEVPLEISEALDKSADGGAQKSAGKNGVEAKKNLAPAVAVDSAPIYYRRALGIRGADPNTVRVLKTNILVERDPNTGDIVTGRADKPDYFIRLAGRDKPLPADKDKLKTLLDKNEINSADYKSAIDAITEISRWYKLYKKIKVTITAGKILRTTFEVDNKLLPDDNERRLLMPVVADTTRELVVARFYQRQDQELNRSVNVLASEIRRKTDEIEKRSRVIDSVKRRMESKLPLPLNVSFAPVEDKDDKDKKEEDLRNTKYYVDQLEKLTPECEELKAQLESLGIKIQFLRDQLAGKTDTGDKFKVVSETKRLTNEGRKLQERLTYLTAQIAEMSVWCTPEHPRLKRYLEERSHIEKIIDHPLMWTKVEETRVAKPERAEEAAKQIELWESDKKVKENQLATKQGQIRDIQTKLEKVPTLERSLIALDKDMQNKYRFLDKLLQDYERAVSDRNIKAAHRFTQFHLQQAANEPELNQPPFIYMLLIGMFIGVLIAGMMVFIAEYLDHSIPGELEAKRQFTYPVLGAIPDFTLIVKEEKKRGLEKWLYWRAKKEPEEADDSFDVV